MPRGKRVRRFMIRTAKRLLPQSLYSKLRTRFGHQKALEASTATAPAETAPTIVIPPQETTPLPEHDKDLVSIVVPAYNVEAYLEECLQSLLDQTYYDIEIIVVIDGATDSSEEIARRIAADNSHVHVICQENTGLSAARNRGAAAATGEFLWFVDSDDVVEPDAVQTMVDALDKSKSEFVVCNYYRFDSTRRWNPGSWIMKAHSVDRRETTLASYPDILVSAVAWNKFYRRSFCEEAGLSFPEGEIYEDQEVSAAAYAKAKAFTVLQKQLYGWRQREDRSSISQQTHDLRDLNGRMRAIRMSIEVLQEEGAAKAAKERLIQFLNNDFQHSARSLVGTSDEYWLSFYAQLLDLTQPMSLQDWTRVHPRYAALEWIMITNHRAEAEQYVQRNGFDLTGLQVSWRNGRLISHVPFWDDESLAIPDQVLEIASSEIKLRHSMRRVRWDPENNTWILSGWAFLDGFLPQASGSTISACLVRGKTRILLDVKRYKDPRIDEWSNSPAMEYSGGAFDIRIYPDALPKSPMSADYEIEIAVANQGVTKTAMVSSVNQWSSTSQAACATSASGTRINLILSNKKTAKVRVEHPAFYLSDVHIENGTIRGSVSANQERGETPQALVVISDASPDNIIASANPVRETTERWSVALPIPSIDWHSEGALLVRVVSSTGRKEMVDWPDAPDNLPLRIPGTDLAIFRNKGGNCALFLPGSEALLVSGIECTEKYVRLTGKQLGTGKQQKVELHNSELRQTADVVWEDDEWTVDLPLTKALWGEREERPLPIGRYVIGSSTAISSTASDQNTEVHLYFGYDVRSRIPVYVDGKDIRYRLEISPTDEANIVVDPPLKDNERGQFAQMTWQKRIPSLGHGQKDDAILFRSYYGEVANCNPLGIHRAIVNAGLDMTMFWGVTDLSVDVPEHGIPVVIGTEQWYETLATSKYLVFNVHQPDYFHRQDGQVIIQTLHGYPFKVAGLPYWQHNGYSNARIASFMERQQEWDYLISPAPYATPLLNETFPFGGKMLEIGYPRNDIFNDTSAELTRKRVRGLLGIPDGVTAVLYAPTYRDYLSSNEFKARAVHFIDETEFAESLGEEYVLLMRGHMMNKRGGDGFATTDRVIDVTAYPQVEELCLASDVGIMDYSSLRFDYALTGKPMVFFVPDKDLYLENSRGALMDYEPTAPGPQVDSEEELRDWLLRLDDLKADYAEERKAFASEFSVWEDGHAGQRLVNEVFLRAD